MKAFTKLFLILFIAIFSQFTINAQGTITWALTANGTASTSTGLTASTLAVGNGLGAPAFSAGSGATSSAWASGSSARNLDEFYEYAISTSPTQTFTVSQVSFDHFRAGGSWDYAVYYSRDNFSTSGILYSTSAALTVTSATRVTATGNLPMPANTRLSFRVYAWTNSGGSNTYSNRNFVITGTTPAALPVTLSSFTAKQTTDNKVALAWVVVSSSLLDSSLQKQKEETAKLLLPTASKM